MDEESPDCKCATSYEYHACPFQVEVEKNEDDNFCSCCPHCTIICQEAI